MDDNEIITGKGMDFMITWQQHYYTWSTKSLSGNKVGLGIVAASDQEREYLCLAGTEGAKSEPCREKENLIIERMYYSEELDGMIRTGVVPSSQSADQRNNKFVHIFSSSLQNQNYPEDYLCPLPFETSWKGERKLELVLTEEKQLGRKTAVAIAGKYGLDHHLHQLCCDVYHCMFTSEQPLVFVNTSLQEEQFGDFSREMMILIHYLLPESFRKEADYVSYVTEMSQEAHFLFAPNQIGKNYRFINRYESRRKACLLEYEFFEQLADKFFLEDDSFDHLLSQIEQTITSLLDKRNQLEKCILSVMASYVGKQKQGEEFFASMERLMYWARKDKSLIPSLKKCMKELDYRTMEESDLFSYVKLMLTGAGGQTKKITFKQLNQILQHYYNEDKDLFYRLVLFVRKNHGGMYEELMTANDTESGFATEVIYKPVDTIGELEYAVKYHTEFLSSKDYEKYLMECAYSLYCHAGEKQKRDRIDRLAKTINEDMFVGFKKKEVEKVIKQAEHLDEYLQIVLSMNLSGFEKPIQALLYRRAVAFLKKEKCMTEDMHSRLTEFADMIHKSKEIESEWVKRKKELEPDECHETAENEKPMEEEEEESAEEENRFVRGIFNVFEDILSKSIWAVILGIYGFVFVTLREEGKILFSYQPSVLFLAGLLLCYILLSLLGRDKKETPGAVIYVMGMAVLLMNWGLALDKVNSIYILYVSAFFFAAAGKAFHFMLYKKRRDDFCDEP